jgi:hypothetical protein
LSSISIVPKRTRFLHQPLPESPISKATPTYGQWRVAGYQGRAPLSPHRTSAIVPLMPITPFQVAHTGDLREVRAALHRSIDDACAPARRRTVSETPLPIGLAPPE